MPLEITTSESLSCIHIINLAYNMRYSFYSSLMIYLTVKIFRLLLAFEIPLLVGYLNPLSPKVSNQTNNGLLIYNTSNYKYNNYFFLHYFYKYNNICNIQTKES